MDVTIFRKLTRPTDYQTSHLYSLFLSLHKINILDYIRIHVTEKHFHQTLKPYQHCVQLHQQWQ